MTENVTALEVKRMKIVLAGVVGVLGVVTALSLASVTVPVWMLVVIGIGAVDVYLIWSIYDRDRRDRLAREEAAAASDFSAPGYSVEVDCRGCGQFNRVPGHRLRQRPKCGRCKARLMPGKRVVLCRVTSSLMKGPLRDELDAVWIDEDRIWQCLADHITLEGKAKGDANNPSMRVVN